MIDIFMNFEIQDLVVTFRVELSLISYFKETLSKRTDNDIKDVSIVCAT